ncbi:MAG TPA: hypothetical protein VFQ68_33230 [Streptosporangiaceae bacterium]|nr:hypothetical protein [Streptosporangiaceae bacterium]
MIQAPGRPRLAECAFAAILVAVRNEDLFDRDLAVQDLVVSRPDEAHATLSQEPAKPVAAGDQAPSFLGHGARLTGRMAGDKCRS